MLRLLLSLPPLAYFVIAGLLVALGFYADDVDRDAIAARTSALESGIPALVKLGDFTASDAGQADEVHVSAQINFEHIYTLRKDSEDSDTAHLLYLLFDPTAKASDRTVQAAVVVPEGQSDDFVDWTFANARNYGPMSPISAFNGTRSDLISYDDVANDKMRDNGFTKDPDFFYITPFMQGRVAALSPRPSDSQSLLLPAWFAAFVVALFGAVKMLFRRRRSKWG